MKSNLEDLYLNIKQCILILLKKYTIWGHNLVLLLLKKRTLFSKIPAVSVHESKRVSCCSQLWKRLYRLLSRILKVSVKHARKAKKRFRDASVNFTVYLDKYRAGPRVLQKATEPADNSKQNNFTFSKF